MRAVLSAGLVLGLALPAEAQETSIDIEPLSSRRVGGKGLTDRERAAYDRAYEPEELLTEENLPPPGAPKRIEGLHTLAERYVGGSMWPEACVKYELILKEGGKEAIAQRERGEINAGRSFLGCAQEAYKDQAFDRAEAHLSQSEDLMGTSSRHRALRWKMLRDEYRAKVEVGDFDGALSRYEKLQSQRESEEERLWFGDAIAHQATAAHEDGDETTRDRLIGIGEKVSPKNVTLRTLQSRLELSQTVGLNILAYGLGGVILVGVLTVLSRWRARARVGDVGPRRRRGKNPFIDDDD